MKKIVFLILFLTGLFPVFNNDGLYLMSYNSYGQGELDEVEVKKCTGVTTTITYETDEFIESEECKEYFDYETKDCVAGSDCILKIEYKEPEDNDPCAPETYDEVACQEQECGITCQPGFELTNLCNCEEIVPPCPNSCSSGYTQMPDCSCELVQQQTDCNGVINGSAYIASCGCIGGNTGKTSCPPPPWNPETQQKIFNNYCDGFKAIWENSFNANGSVYKESHGVLVWDSNDNIKFIAFPMNNNTATSSNLPNMQIKVLNGHSYVDFGGVTYEVIAIVHTHPDDDPSMSQVPTDNNSGVDDYSSIQTLRDYGDPDITGYVISKNTIYNFGINSSGGKEIFEQVSRTNQFNNGCQ